jgi:hypothetical protein
MAIEHDSEWSGPLREPAEQILLGGEISRGLAQTVFLINQIDSDFGPLPEFRVPVQKYFGRWPVAVPPTTPHLASQLLAKAASRSHQRISAVNTPAARNRVTGERSGRIWRDCVGTNGWTFVCR